MLTFKQFCELMTHRHTGLPYSWFSIPHRYAEFLDETELSQVHLEDDKCGNYRVWYPKEKWENRPIGKEELQRMLALALEKEDYDAVLRLKSKLKQTTQQTIPNTRVIEVEGIKPEDFEKHGISRR